MAKIKDRISEIVKLREELLNELKSLQEACTHDEYHIGTFSWRAGSYDQMKICTECNSTLGTPSDNELSDYNNEYDELNKAYIEKCKIDEERCIKEGNVYIKSNLRIGQGTKIYKS